MISVCRLLIRLKGKAWFRRKAASAGGDAAVARHRRGRPGPRPRRHVRRAAAAGQAQGDLHAVLDTGDHVVDRQRGEGEADRPQGRAEDLSPAQRLRRRPARRAREGRAPEAPGAARRRSRARHAAEDEDGRGDVPQAEGLRRAGSPARGAETLASSRSRNVAADAVLRNGPPQDVHRPRVPPARHRAPSPSTTARSKRSSPPRRCAPRSASRWCSPRPPTSSTSSRRSPAAAWRDRPARVRLGIARALVEYNLELRKRLEERRPPDARRARQGTQEIRHGRSAQALPVQQTLIGTSRRGSA